MQHRCNLLAFLVTPPAAGLNPGRRRCHSALVHSFVISPKRCILIRTVALHLWSGAVRV